MHDVIILGSGMGSLSAAATLANKGLKPLILEQNWIPGGCTTSYPRKGFVFEAGATTLVGLDDHMPLKHLIDDLGIKINARKLDLPMQVHMKHGKVINKYQDLNSWITEAKKHFGGNQEKFWRKAYAISQFVWKSSTKYLNFPPAKPSDFLKLAMNANPLDLIQARYAFKSTSSVLSNHDFQDEIFQSFIDEQLLITAQNRSNEVNFLFGAAALCYTNYGNYYVDGGLRNLVQPIIDFIQKKGGKIVYREGALEAEKIKNGYAVKTKAHTYESKYLISGIPLNNFSEIAPDIIPKNQKVKLLESEDLYSAFQMGIAFKSERAFESLHHQIHLDQPLPQTGSQSIFLSLNHEEDTTRSEDRNIRIASVSTHIKNPKKTLVNTDELESVVVGELIKRGFLEQSDIVYQHSSGPKSWAKWTGRAHGFVGGYPQYFKTKPWQMVEARIDKIGAYQCGDTAYPGQGIPGATLSGLIAANKLITDWL